MGRFIFVLAICYIIAGGLGLASKAHGAEMRCGETDQIHKRFAEKYKEVPFAVGVTNTSGLMEVLTSKTGSWTMIMNFPSGKTCFVAAGEGWRKLEQISTDPEA